MTAECYTLPVQYYFLNKKCYAKMSGLSGNPSGIFIGHIKIHEFVNEIPKDCKMFVSSEKTTIYIIPSPENIRIIAKIKLME